MKFKILVKILQKSQVIKLDNFQLYDECKAVVYKAHHTDVAPCWVSPHTAPLKVTVFGG